MVLADVQQDFMKKLAWPGMRALQASPEPPAREAVREAKRPMAVQDEGSAPLSRPGAGRLDEKLSGGAMTAQSRELRQFIQDAGATAGCAGCADCR